MSNESTHPDKVESTDATATGGEEQQNQPSTGAELKHEMRQLIKQISKGDKVPVPNRKNLLTVVENTYRGHSNWTILAEGLRGGEYKVRINIRNPNDKFAPHAFSLSVSYKDRQQKVGECNSFETFINKAEISKSDKTANYSRENNDK